MKNGHAPHLFSEDEESITYVEGLGFLPTGGGKPLSSQIRNMSNVICLFLVLYFLVKMLFQFPITYLISLLDLGVGINHYTGLITYTPFSRLAVELLDQAISLLLILLVLAYIYRRALAANAIFRPARSGINGIAIPLLVGTGLLSMALGNLFEQLNIFFGLVFDSLPAPISHLDGYVFLGLGGTLVMGFLEELFFRGVVLTPLRRFGDGFAVVASALLFAFWRNGPVNAVSGFLFGICAAYFVIRAGSIRTALYSRILLELILFGLRCAEGLLPAELSRPLLLGSCLVLLVAALAAYLIFIHKDQHAFRMLPSLDRTRTLTKLGLFCTSFSFLLLAVTMVFKMVSTIQMIGW